MAEKFEVVVIGAGIVGAGAAYSLAKQGKKTLLLEQFSIGHDRGSSHGRSRIFRLSYEHVDYVALAKESLQMWRTLEAESGARLLTVVGGLDIGPDGNLTFSNLKQAMAEMNVEFTELSTKNLEERFPQFALRENHSGIYQKDTGVLDAETCVRTMIDLARKAGLSVKERIRVQAIEPGLKGIDIVLDGDVVRADKLIVSAGAWLGDLLAPLGLKIPFTVTKEQYCFYKPKDEKAFAKDVFPVFCEYSVDQARSSLATYGFPMFEKAAVKLAGHHRGPITTGDDRNFDLEIDNLQFVDCYIRERFPQLSTEYIDWKTCLYTNTPDEHFVLDLLPGDDRIVIAACCSGHGFKFGPLTGKIAADLALTGRTSYPVSLFSVSRFANVVL